MSIPKIKIRGTAFQANTVANNVGSATALFVINTGTVSSNVVVSPAAGPNTGSIVLPAGEAVILIKGSTDVIYSTNVTTTFATPVAILDT